MGTKGDTAMAFVFFGIGIAILFGAATGLVCALLRLRYQALVLLPLSAGLALGSVLSGIALHAHPVVVATGVFGAVIASQLAYVAVSLTHHFVHGRRLTSHLLPHIQASIGQRLRAELEVPHNMPAELSRLLAQLA